MSRLSAAKMFALVYRSICWMNPESPSATRASLSFLPKLITIRKPYWPKPPSRIPKGNCAFPSKCAPRLSGAITKGPSFRFCQSFESTDVFFSSWRGISNPSPPIAEFPHPAPPQVVVSSGYIGANAQTVESAVTIPLEQAINGVQGMKYISSTSGNDGSSQITVTFDVTRDVDLASVDVQNRVNQALGRLPNTVKNTGVIITKQLGGFVFGAGA